MSVKIDSSKFNIQSFFGIVMIIQEDLKREFEKGSFKILVTDLKEDGSVDVTISVPKAVVDKAMEGGKIMGVIS